LSNDYDVNDESTWPEWLRADRASIVADAVSIGLDADWVLERHREYDAKHEPFVCKLCDHRSPASHRNAAAGFPLCLHATRCKERRKAPCPAR
jgi:hypothetical protein